MFLRSIHVDMHIKDIFAPLLKETLVSFDKSSSDHRPKIILWDGGTGCHKKKGSYGLGQWHGKQPFPQLAILYVPVSSLGTFVAFPAPGHCRQAVGFWDLQSSQCGATFLCLDYFSRGKSSNFLKSIWMWRKAVCSWLLLDIMQNKNSARKKNMYIIASDHCIVFCWLHIYSTLFIHFLVDGAVALIFIHNPTKNICIRVSMSMCMKITTGYVLSNRITGL